VAMEMSSGMSSNLEDELLRGTMIDLGHGHQQENQE